MSNLQALTVPKWGMEMEEGEITEWRVGVGDQVSKGDEVVDIETSKIINTVESSCTGTLVRIVAQPGEIHRVATLLGVVAVGDASDEDIDAFIANFKPDAAALLNRSGKDEPSKASPAPAVNTQAAEAPQTSGQPAPARVSLAEGPDDSEVNASVVARRLARENNLNLHNVRATGRHGRVSKRDVEQALGLNSQPRRMAISSAAASASATRSIQDDSRIAATPVARRLAKKLNINLHDIQPTGRRNRVSKEDVELAARAIAGAVDYHEESLSSMRRTIAARLTETKQAVPHYRVSVDIEIDSLLSQRRYMNTALGQRISVNDFIIKACGGALSRVPQLNVQFAGDRVRHFAQADIAVAVAVPGGLITPVIRNVGGKGLPQIAAEARDLAERARAGRVAADEVQGGTFTISNLGMHEVDQFDAIINAPQAAILAVAAGREKPVVRDGKIEVATVMRVSLSCDHRLIDGSVAAEFLGALKGLLENPASMLI
ncbi:dihydrolipoamide acetyltransferase family protein [Microbulbifer sp. SA54]|uniref:dihydrolipoamide acetyltransferase family protein n=1 Tax=Microbulbifer sp. SA54 TaxID=3401577 RepID=UPI003AAB1710